MPYIDKTTGTYPVSEADIRAANPNTSFPVPFVAPEQYAVVFPSPVVYDPATQVAIEAAPVLTNKGHWEQAWTITDKSAEQLAAEAEAARQASIPRAVTMRQARLALLQAGKYAAVGSIIDGLPEPQKTAARIEWEYSNEVQRHNGFVDVIGPALGMTELEIDALFIAAAKL